MELKTRKDIFKQGEKSLLSGRQADGFRFSLNFNLFFQLPSIAYAIEAFFKGLYAFFDKYGIEKREVRVLLFFMSLSVFITFLSITWNFIYLNFILEQ